MKRLYLLFFVIVAGYLIVTGFLPKRKSSGLYQYPPGTVQLDSNFYADRTEITNFSYLEYIYWVQLVFGEKSQEYMACLPNEEVWNIDYDCLKGHADIYLKGPFYPDYPVVGITQQQAKDYCSWRSDRVFEAILVKDGVIEMNSYQNRSNYFSIKNYFSGKYNNTPPDTGYFLYPHYKLPTSKEWERMRNFFRKSGTKEKIKLLKKHYSSTKPFVFDSVNYYHVPCKQDTFIREPVKAVFNDPSNNGGYFIYGNVSEWLEEAGKCIGGNWTDSSKVNYDKPLQAEGATAYIGFRAVFKWKKYVAE